MKLMLRPEWRLWPLSSFLGVLDIKTGATISLLFALLNKVAGVYGLIAVVTGAGGSFAQLSLYIYSVLALLALTWGLRSVKEEDPRQTLYFAHVFFADHVISTSWTVFFAVDWWFYQPHDGRRQANSPAQKYMIEISHIANIHLSDEEREAAAMAIWSKEKGTAAFVIIFSWLFRLYLVLLLYSYATHLRKGSFRSLPLSRSAAAAASGPISGSPFNGAYESALGFPDEDEELEDFYRVPLRAPTAKSPGFQHQHRRGSSRPNKADGSVTSFTDFVSAPSRTRKSGGHARNGSRQQHNHARTISRTTGGFGDIATEDILFDEDESTAYASTSSRSGPSRFGTEAGSSTAASDEERAVAFMDGRHK
ncbi:hypothetical protein AMATHDRAFT_58175 [Amanita thiersii Skay4041]|uniref:DUF1753-domain-containing protein n=1 Tax=Amanita thiersii Skay4041 TaxID=703135 RepID=A0A2A9NVX2_9AGAR|nr:hypothetical protein AMATHDRAFT_58175 [Amanita thiersii Skay4041]